MFIKTLRKQYLAQTVLVMLFAAGLLIAQLAAIDHDAHHPFHKHTHLCDSFAQFGHSKTSLTQANTLAVAVEISSVYIQLVVLSPRYNKSNVIRIRGPPSLLV